MSVKIPNPTKLSPRLRMILNGSETVNTMRAEQDPSLVVRRARTRVGIPSLLTRQIRTSSARLYPGELPREKLERIATGIEANVIIRLKNGGQRLPDVLANLEGDLPVVHRNDLVSATIPLDKIPELLDDPAVVAVESPGSITFIPPIRSSLYRTGSAEPPTSRERWSIPGGSEVPLTVKTNRQPVLVGIIDVQGFDFAHPDFLDQDGNTRFIAIWDQAGSSHPAPARFGYGSELTERMLKKAIKSQGRYRLPATQLEPQTEMVNGSHGTHVASIAAGNHGICPEARIAAVLLSLGKGEDDRRASFYDSSRLLHAVDYLFQLSQKLELPVSINISLGTNGHSHDATSLISRWLDYELATPGRAVSVAAGNAGQKAPITPGDTGYMLGRIHTRGTLTPDNPVVDLDWEVIGNGITDISENELEIWFSECDHFSVQVKPPYGDWCEVVQPGQFLENQFLDNKTVLSIYNERYVPVNGLNYIACYLSPYLSKEAVIGVQGGTWQVRLSAQTIRDGRYHAWIERDDPYRYAPADNRRQVWAFPSFFSEKSNVGDTSVSSLACGNSILSVANFNARLNNIHHTSSQGPTRDGRQKPDIAGPGTDIIAACGFEAEPEAQWLAMTGTSMASPFVCGVAACMLSVDPELTAAQITGILHHTARPLNPGHAVWENKAGFGVIDPQAALEEVSLFRDRKDLKP